MPGVFQWSKTTASNASADPSVNWAEGQAPSSVNDSARALMTSVAKFRDDISGAIVTTGTSAAYIVASNQVFDTLANFHGKVIAFSPHVTNAVGPVTMTVDGFANLPVRTSPNVELLAGTIIAGTPYTCTYNNTDGALYLHGFYPANTTYNIPLAGGMDFWGAVVPNSSFAFPAGQAISRATYATLFAIMSTTYGTGDGSTTFNLPDKTGRVSAMKETVGTRLTTAGVGVDGGTMGSAGGGSQTLITTNLPPYTPSGTIGNAVSGGTFGGSDPGGASISAGGATPTVKNSVLITVTGTFAGSAQGGTSTPIKIAQPTIVCNYIIRII